MIPVWTVYQDKDNKWQAIDEQKEEVPTAYWNVIKGYVTARRKLDAIDYIKSLEIGR